MKKSDGISKNSVFLMAVGVSLLGLFSGCGRTEFNVLATQQNQTSPGYFYIPPKVDIMMVQDNTAGMAEIHSSIAQEVPNFLSKLDTQKWDYHFATNPLTTFRAQIPQVAGSIYDSNRPGWTAPYPGAQPGGLGTIIAQFFRLPTTFTDFLSASDITNRDGRKELGFETILNTLRSGVQGTGFLRSDALLAVVVLGAGNDTSNLNFCRRSDGLTVRCESESQPACKPTASDPTGGSTTCASDLTSFDYYKKAIQAIHTNTRFYAAVNVTGRNPCLTGSTYLGDRYMRMARELNGKQYDICSQSVSEVLTSLAQDLTAVRLEYKIRYLILEREPDLSTVVVTKYPDGDTSKGQVIKQDANDGWTYVGYVTDTEVIDEPILMNKQTGFALQLHGSAKLGGNDKASISYKQAGAKNTVTP